MAKSIVGLATTLKLHTVAEGIEHADQRAQLLALGCGYGQGFLFARPVSAETISGLLRAGGLSTDPAGIAAAIVIGRAGVNFPAAAARSQEPWD